MKFDWDLIGSALAFLLGMIFMGFPLITLIILGIPNYFGWIELLGLPEDETVFFLLGVSATIAIGIWIYNINDFYKMKKEEQKIPLPIDVLIREKEHQLKMLKEEKRKN